MGNKFEVDNTGKAVVTSLQVTTSPVLNHVLTADASGNATWQAAQGGVTAHSALTGLTIGDDHSQYLRKDALTTLGDLYYRDGSGVTRLPRGTAGKVLMADDALGVKWETPTSGVIDHGLLEGLGDNDHPQYLLVSTLTTKGDLLYHNGAAITRLAPGADGYVLTANTTNGVVWAPAPGSSGGEANTASNLGTGEGTYAQKIGVDLQFKSLKAGTNVTLSSDVNEITINATGGGTGGHIIQDEGIDVVPQSSYLNFTGGGIQVSDVGGVTTVLVPLSISVILDGNNGNQQVPQRSTIKFIGGGVTLSDDGATVVTIPERAPGGQLSLSNDYTIQAGDHGKILVVDTNGALRTITLPLISTLGAGFEIILNRVGANNLVIASTSPDWMVDIQGGTLNHATLAESPWASVRLTATTSGWLITGGNGTWTTA